MMSDRLAFLRSSLLVLAAAAVVALGVAVAQAAETQAVPLADGFETPVGKGGSGVYHRARGFTPNGHLGEDWNGAGGGDSDLGDPIIACAHGLVVFAEDYHVGWGNVVIIRHAYLEEGEVKFVDSLYGHLNDFSVKTGQIVRRGQQIGTMGNNRGMYDAHLHFEMRKNLAIGMARNSFARDFTNYYDPTRFILTHRQLVTNGQYAAVPVNTFQKPAPSTAAQYAGPVTGPATSTAGSAATKPAPRLPAASSSNPRGPFRVDRYGDMR